MSGTWLSRFSRIDLTTSVVRTDDNGEERFDTQHPAYAAFRDLVWCAIDSSQPEVVLQVNLAAILNKLFHWSNNAPMAQGDLDRILRETAARGQSGNVEGRGNVRASIGSDLSCLHASNGRDYKKTGPHAAEMAVMDEYKRRRLNPRESAQDPGQTTGAPNMPSGSSRKGKAASRQSQSATRPSQATSVSNRSSSTTAAGTRHPDVWLVAVAYIIRVVQLKTRLKYVLEIFRVTPFLAEVKKFTLTRKPTKAAVSAICEGLAQVCMYLCAASDICGTYAGLVLANTRFSRVCLADVEVMDTGDSDGVPERIYKVAVELGTELLESLSCRQMRLSDLLGEIPLNGIDRYRLLANDIVLKTNEAGRPVLGPEGDVVLSAPACQRMWACFRTALQAIGDMQWDKPLPCIPPASAAFESYRQSLETSAIMDNLALQTFDLTPDEMRRVCAARRGPEYTTLFRPDGEETRFETEYEVDRQPASESVTSLPTETSRGTSSSAGERPRRTQPQHRSRPRPDASAVPTEQPAGKRAPGGPIDRLQSTAYDSSPEPSYVVPTPPTPESVDRLDRRRDCDQEQAISHHDRSETAVFKDLARFVDDWRHGVPSTAPDLDAPAPWPKYPETHVRVLAVSTDQMDRLLELRRG